MLVTMHATVMIFFVIIPILAGAFGNFLIPLMIGADDMAVPDFNMLSYWFMWPAFICHGHELLCGRRCRARRAGPSYPPLSASSRRRRAAQRADAVADWADLRRHLVDDGVGQLHDDDHSDAGPGHDDVPPADDDLGHVHHRHPAGVRLARADRGRLHAVDRSHARDRLFHSRRADRPTTRRSPPAADSRCCGSTCSGSTATRPSTS